MPKGTIALAMMLALGAGLRANPDETGALKVSLGSLFLGADQQGTRSVGLTPLKAEYKVESQAWLEAATAVGLTEWLSAFGGINGETYGERMNETANGGASGTYTADNAVSGRHVWGGFTLYPSAFWAGPFLPGLGNPQGLLYWPSLDLQYWQDGYEHSQTLVQASGGYSLNKANLPFSERVQGWAWNLTLPLHERFSLGLGQRKETWHQFFNANSSASYADGSETLQLQGWFFLPLRNGDPERVDDYFPLLGKPGTLRLNGGYSISNDLAFGRQGVSSWWIGAAYPINNLFAAEASYSQVDLVGLPLDSYTLTSNDPNNRFVNLSIAFNYGALPWAGRPKKFEPDAVPVNVKTDAPAPDSIKDVDAAPSPDR